VGLRAAHRLHPPLVGPEQKCNFNFITKWLGQARHQMWVGLATFAGITQTAPSNFQALVNFEFPLQRWSLAVKPQQRLSTEHKSKNA